MILIFLIAFVFSFLGSIPPGAINLSVLQLSIDNHFKAAIRFSIAAALVEFPYAFIAVKFQAYLVSTPFIMENLKLIAGVVMILLGAINIYSASNKESDRFSKFHRSGFRKGIIISILNPLAIPFWVGVTAYLSGIQWIDLSSNSHIFWYVTGISFGTFCLLGLLALLGRRVSFLFKSSNVIHYIPGLVFLLLGLYALIQFFNLI